MLLTALTPGSSARVRSVSAESDAVLRLREMGLRAGALVRLDAVAAGGARVLAVGGSRLAVDGTTASLIEVDAA